MKKALFFSMLAVAALGLCWKLYDAKHPRPVALTAQVKPGENEEKEDGIREAQELEFEKTKDIKLGYVPKDRLVTAYTQLMRNRMLHVNSPNSPARADALTWTERGPDTDAAGPYGNSRASGGATSGRMRAIWVDLNDATNKTVWVGGIDGGLWKTTDVTASPATWTLINDFFGNLAISSICQDPNTKTNLYFGTGEKAGNTDAVRGGGVWKSTNSGATWSLLASTTSFWNVSKVACDASGNIYVATVGNSAGIQRSTDGGTTWTNITPSGVSSLVTDMKISSTGRLHIVCGYQGSSPAGYFFTSSPSTVTSATWTSPTTAFSPVQYNCELAVAGNTLYVLNADNTYSTSTVFKSTDGGANWSLASNALPTTGNNALSSGQAWYNMALAVDPVTPTNVVAGGLNVYKSTDGGSTWSQVTVWVGGISGTVTNYVHADQHTAVWNGSQVLIGCDGGLFYSSNGGSSFADRNVGLRLKQFYSCAIHPSSTNYFLAGAQDNGCHAFSSAGLSGTTEVNGGDGAFVHIDQDEPQYQFTSYIRSQYHRSSDGGANWTDVNYSSSLGSFINPTDYDDGNNIMYTGSTGTQYVRWDDPQTGSTFNTVSIAALGSSSVSTIKVSPFTSNRVFFGGYAAKILKVDNANTASPTITDITGSGMTAGFVSCIATGTSDNNLLATSSSYGAVHVWVSTTGGGSAGWTNISGNLPDIPVRWAMFYPEDNTMAIIATEMGVYETTLINGASTVWTQDPSFPIVRTDMLKYRKSDGTIAAATHGRGLWTSTIPFTNPYIRFALNYATKQESTTSTSGCRGYTDYTVNMTIDAAPTGTATVTLSVAGGATAVQGVDYDFTTNGSFSSPSTTLTFASGATTPQPVTIRIYDDASIEGTESFTLNYAVTGATNALAAPSCPSYTMNIKDNDVAPVAPSGSSGTFSLGSYVYNLGSSTTGNPFNAQVASNRSQILYKASELTAAGAAAGNITSVAFTMIKNSVRAFQNFKINMGSTTLTYLVNGSVNVVSTSTYKTLSSYTTVNGLNTFTLDAPFVWDGTSSVVVEICYDNGTTSGSDFCDVLNGYSDGGSSSQWNMYWQNAINCSGSFSSVNGFNTGIKPTITFGLSPSGNPVDSTLSATKTAYLGPNKDVYFYDASGNVLARITNLSSFDYGCTQVIIDRAGTSSTQFWNNNTANYLMNKTFHVIPTTNNASGSYQVTLYYTGLEKSGWETATGQSFSNIQLVKVAGQISQVTPATPAAAGAVSVVTPTVGTYGTGYTLTYTFNNGFSGFGAGIPAAALPVTLLSFTGRLDNNVIPLSWSTSSEQNLDYFEVQKSVDGAHFYPLARVKAAGNSNTQRNYGYTDKQVSELNYYRLAMTDIDGKFVLSNVVLVKNPGVQQQVWVVNNPFSSYIDLRFAKMPQQQVQAELLTVSGATVFTRAYAASAQLRLDMGAAHISAGAYLLRTTVDGKRYINKVIKQ